MPVGTGTGMDALELEGVSSWYCCTAPPCGAFGASPFQGIQLCLGRIAPVDVRTTRVTRGPYTDG